MTRAALLAAACAVAGCNRDAPVSEETRAREAWVKEIAARDGLDQIWSLVSRSDLQFEDGLAPLEVVDPEVPFAAWSDPPPRANASGPGLAVRWMGPRAHLRVRGSTAMDLAIRGRIDLVRIMTRPLITASLDGVEFWSGFPDTQGYFLIDATIPAERLTGWADIHVVLSSAHEPWRDPGSVLPTQLSVARLEGVTWEPVGAPVVAP